MSWLQQVHRFMSESFKETQPKCLWCLKEFDPYPHLVDCFYEPRVMCEKCHERLDFHPRKFKLNGVTVRSLYNYDDAFSKLLIQYKENRDLELKFVFSELLRGIKFKGLKVVMPSSKEKLVYRGFHHLLEIYGFDCLNPFIKVDNQKQMSSGRDMREKIQFQLVETVVGKVVLVDDVITTGSTLKEAIRLLPDCRISCFVLAYREFQKN